MVKYSGKKYEDSFVSSAEGVIAEIEEMRKKEKQRAAETKEREKKDAVEAKERKKERAQESKEYVERVFNKHESEIVKGTLDNIKSRFEEKKLPPYNVSYVLKEHFNDSESKMFEEKLRTELLKVISKIPGQSLNVSVESESIEHKHRLHNRSYLQWIHDYTEYIVYVNIELHF